MVKYNQYSELYHYGIKGQKWGVRRYQNADGSLTPEGYRHYGIQERQMLRMHGDYDYMTKDQRIQFNKELDKLDSKKLAEQRVKDLKALKISAAIGIGVGLTIAGAYMYKTYGSTFLDKTLKPGSSLQTLSMANDRFSNHKQYGETIYTSITGRDKNNYMAWFSKGRASMGEDPKINKFKIGLEATSKIKIASRKSGEKVFNDLIKNDSEFSNLFNKIYDPDVKKLYRERFDDYKNLTDYRIFNIGLVNTSSTDKKELKQKFFDAMKNRGYAGLTDENDVVSGMKAHMRRGSSWQTSRPTILFDLKDITEKSNTRITDAEIKKAQSRMSIEAIQSQPGLVGLIASLPTVGTATAIGNKKSKQAKTIKKQTKERTKKNVQ